MILNTRYLAPCGFIPCSGSLHTLWAYAENPDYHHLFNKLVRVKPATFRFILGEIKDNPIFRNSSHCPQAPVELQLAIALHRLGRYGNGASMDDVAFLAGVGHGTVPLYTKRVITAILDLHGRYIRVLTDEERAHDLGFTGATHDSLAFHETAAYKHPDLIFCNDEFAWADSAYTPSYRVIPIHHTPANLNPRVRAFDKAVSHLRVRSEHCNGSIKLRFQCLRGMCVSINSRADHLAAMRQISACFVLHNMCIVAGGDYWEPDEELGHHEWDMEWLAEQAEVLAGAERRRHLVDAYHYYRHG
ncbi:hypothetical protein FRC06_004162 [Ceratobasidium sp. 370]|nr:hypothetical protein FRC06_004162 [Ceratobasidium sp. 370]